MKLARKLHVTHRKCSPRDLCSRGANLNDWIPGKSDRCRRIIATVNGEFNFTKDTCIIKVTREGVLGKDGFLADSSLWRMPDICPTHCKRDRTFKGDSKLLAPESQVAAVVILVQPQPPQAYV